MYKQVHNLSCMDNGFWSACQHANICVTRTTGNRKSNCSTLTLNYQLASSHKAIISILLCFPSLCSPKTEAGGSNLSWPNSFHAGPYRLPTLKESGDLSIKILSDTHQQSALVSVKYFHRGAECRHCQSAVSLVTSKVILGLVKHE